MGLDNPFRMIVAEYEGDNFQESRKNEEISEKTHN